MKVIPNRTVANQNKILIGVVAAVSLLSLYIVRRIRARRNRTQWTKPWLQRRTKGRGILNLLNKELQVEDKNLYKNFLRMDEEKFTFILQLIEKDILKQDTLMRSSVSAKHRLYITMHESTISKFLPEVCSAIIKRMKGEYLQTPTSEEWKKIAVRYENKWTFPHCIGALDGRHIVFTAPTSSGSYYYNYKQKNSIVLLALVDADYRFTYVNVGVNGRVSHGGVFEACKLSKALENNKLGLPQPECLPGMTQKLPYVIIADDAFPLMDNLMKPFPQRGLTKENRIYNYRLSRARRMVESAFGILANRFRVLLNPIHLSPEKVEIITLTCVVLHNFLATKSKPYIDQNIDIQINESTMHPLHQQSGNRSSTAARLTREKFKTYFNSDIGAVPWQNSAVERGNC